MQPGLHTALFRWVLGPSEVLAGPGWKQEFPWQHSGVCPVRGRETALSSGHVVLCPHKGCCWLQAGAWVTRATALHWTFFVFPTVNIVLSGRLSSAVPALGE